jgi:hypothetical protein
MPVSLKEQTRFRSLLALAQRQFPEPLLRTEQRLLQQSVMAGDVANVFQGQSRTSVRAEFLRWLVTDAQAAEFIDPKGVRIASVTIAGDLDLEGCGIAHRLHFLACAFQGKLILYAAKLPALYLLHCELGGGMWADGVAVEQAMHLRRVSSFGSIRLLGARIGGNLECPDTSVQCLGESLALDGARIDGGVLLDRLQASGEVRMLRARIGGDLNCNGAVLQATEVALMVEAARIRGDVQLGAGFRSAGRVVLTGARIDGDLDCDGAVMPTLEAARMRVAGALRWTGIEEATALRLNRATVGVLRDDRASWPVEGGLEVEGFTYEELIAEESSGIDVIERIEWLRRQSPASRRTEQPWRYLAAVLRAKGDHRGARRVIYAMRREQAQGELTLLRAWKLLLARVEERL